MGVGQEQQAGSMGFWLSGVSVLIFTGDCSAVGSVKGKGAHFLNWNLEKFEIAPLPRDQGSIWTSRLQGVPEETFVPL